MTTLTTDDFTQAEQDAINFRINIIDQDIAQLQAQVPDPTTKFNAVSIFDDANQRVQDAAIAELITLLHGILVDRDDDEPSEAPHSIKFEPPDPGGQNPSFPVNAPELFSTDNLTTYLAALPSYTTPFATATLENGEVDVGTPTGGWELWREKTTPPPGREADPDQPEDPELPDASFDVIKQEFDERNGERLDSIIGSYVLKQIVSNQITNVNTQIALLEQRRDFWTSIGFPTT